MPATTTNYSWNKPTVGGDEDAWGGFLNGNWDALDTLLGGVTNTEFQILDGATVTTAELNILDGVTSTAAELNLLDGVTATTAELNYVDGVTSAIQTQLNAKGTVSSLSDLSITSTATELNTLDGIPATLTATELGYVDGVTSAIQTQLDAKVGATYTGDVDITGELIVDSYNETYGAVTSSSNATTVNCEAGNAFSHTLTENTTFTFSNPPASGTAYSFSIEIIQDGSHLHRRCRHHWRANR